MFNRREIAGLITVTLILCILIPPLVSDNTNLSNEGQESVSNNKTTLSYDSHDPIEILSDAEFDSLASIEGWSGDGSSGNPYVIENLEIQSNETCLKIRTVNYHFVISNCRFSSPMDEEGYRIHSTGVLISNSLNGEVSNCIFETLYTGISSSHSDDIVFRSNAIHNVSTGISLSSSDNNHIFNNTISDALYNVKVSYSYSCIIANNSISDSKQLGLSLNSYPCTIANNSFVGAGIGIQFSTMATSTHNFENNIVNDRPVGYFEGSSNEVIDVSAYGQAIFVNCTNIVIQNGVFADTSHTILIGFCENSTVRNNQFVNSNWGIFLVKSHRITIEDTMSSGSNIQAQYSEFLTIQNCTVVDGSYGIQLIFSDHSAISNCVLNNNSIHALGFVSSVNYTLQGNSIQGRGLYIRGSSLDHWIPNLSGNALNGGPLGYFLNQTDSVLNADGYDQLILVNCSNVEVLDGEFLQPVSGVHLAFCNNVNLMNHVIHDASRQSVKLFKSSNCTLTNIVASNAYSEGIYLDESPNCTIISCSLTGAAIRLDDSVDCKINGNTITDNEATSGIGIQTSHGSIISRNEIENCKLNGINVLESDNSTIMDNIIIKGLSDGILLAKCDSCILTNNTVKLNEGHGISLTPASNFWANSTNCQVSGNTIFRNGMMGIHISAGISNMIFNNMIGWNLLGNAHDEGVNNTWDDDVSIGNLWQDYSGTGTYSIPGSAGSVDRYPIGFPTTISTTEIILTPTTSSTTISAITSSTTPTSTTPVDDEFPLVLILILVGCMGIFITAIVVYKRKG
ncbi:MAG: right-handed parallel beta-helix repeat-containing protein [Candidatus Thorarchaeota archaeon]